MDTMDSAPAVEGRPGMSYLRAVVLGEESAVAGMQLTLRHVFDLGLAVGTLEERVVISCFAPHTDGLLCGYGTGDVWPLILDALSDLKKKYAPLASEEDEELAKNCAERFDWLSGKAQDRFRDGHEDKATQEFGGAVQAFNLNDDGPDDFMTNLVWDVPHTFSALPVVGALTRLVEGLRKLAASKNAQGEQAFLAGKEVGRLLETPDVMAFPNEEALEAGGPAALSFVPTALLQRQGRLAKFWHHCNGLQYDALAGITDFRNGKKAAESFIKELLGERAFHDSAPLLGRRDVYLRNDIWGKDFSEATICEALNEDVVKLKQKLGKVVIRRPEPPDVLNIQIYVEREEFYVNGERWHDITPRMFKILKIICQIPGSPHTAKELEHDDIHDARQVGPKMIEVFRSHGIDPPDPIVTVKKQKKDGRDQWTFTWNAQPKSEQDANAPVWYFQAKIRR